MLAERPISTPAIFSLAGVKPDETAVIERTEKEARVHEGANAAANHWQAPGWWGSRAATTAPGARGRCIACRPSSIRLSLAGAADPQPRTRASS